MRLLSLLRISGFVPPAGAVFNNQKSAVFNGSNSKQTAPNNAAINFTKSQAFSGGAWIKTNGFSDYQAIFSKADGSTSQGYLFQVGLDARLRLFIIDASTRYSFKQSAALITANTWQHVGFSYDGSGLASGMKFYIDGVLRSLGEGVSDDIVGDMNGGGNLVIGAHTDGTWQFFNGKIDEVFIVSGVLSDQDFSDIYNSGVPASLASYNPLVWVREENNNADSGSLGLSFVDTSITYAADVPT